MKHRTNGKRRLPGRGTAGRFMASRSGAVAVEWAMVGPIVIFMLLFSFESMTYMLMSSDLDRALREVAFEIRTGQAEGIATKQKWTPEEYVKRQVCAKYSFSDCLDRLSVNVRSFQIDGQAAVQSLPSDIYRSMVLQLISVEMPFSLQTMSRLYSDKPWMLRAAQGYMTEPF